MKHLTKNPLYLIPALMLTILLAGCQATVDTRWATTQDTLDHWQPLAAGLPVEVRGEWPNASDEQIARAVSNAVFASASTGAVSAPRFVVEMGSNAPGADNTYCVEKPATQANNAAATPLAMTLTLCDGTRVVAQSSASMRSANVTAEDLSREIDHLKNMALIGIEKNEPHLVETMD